MQWCWCITDINVILKLMPDNSSITTRLISSACHCFWHAAAAAAGDSLWWSVSWYLLCKNWHGDFNIISCSTFSAIYPQDIISWILCYPYIQDLYPLHHSSYKQEYTNRNSPHDCIPILGNNVFFLNDCIPILGNNGFFKHFALQKKCHLTTVNPTFTRIMSMKPRTNTVSFIVGRISNNTLMEMPSFLPLIKYNSLQSLSVGPVPPAPSVPRSPAIHEAMTHAWLRKVLQTLTLKSP